jgi:hypothetical protein
MMQEEELRLSGVKDTESRYTLLSSLKDTKSLSKIATTREFESYSI